MLRTNLSTRPFYNIRAVQAVLSACAAIVILFTMFNVISLVRLAASQRSLGARAVQAQDDATRLRADAARVRAQVDAKELEVVSGEAREAKSIIEMRSFSWGELLTQLPWLTQADLPPTRVSNTGMRRDAGPQLRTTTIS